MLDDKKIREIDATTPGLEIQESSYQNYEKLVILKALKFFQEIETSGGLARYIGMADAAEPKPAGRSGDTIETYSSSDFLLAINGKDADAVWAIMDDVMSDLRVYNVRAYNSAMRRIRDL